MINRFCYLKSQDKYLKNNQTFFTIYKQNINKQNLIL